ncbi:DEAD/DEAH box helicase [Loigolactobacillus coryniformis subsp. coryniformis]|uniref:DEAD/DEAH box helicase n=1 Tax=Loigolactobacillus coryniformis TaxID=1610 RepID=UPI00399333B3
MNQLRDYQQETVDDITKSLRTKHHSIVVQQPPRTGKTIIMAEIAKRATCKGNRVMLLVHRKELVDQTRRTFISWGVNMNLCDLGMVQTLTRRTQKLKQPTIILIDEAHHAIARSYRKILDTFPEAIRLLFTATPWRMGGKGMIEVADDLLQGKSVQWLIDNDFLAPVKYFAPPDINEGLLKRARGEYTEQSIDDALSKQIYGNAVEHYLKHANGKKAIAYCHSIKSAKHLADEFNKRGISALEVDGKSPKEERASAVEQFRNGSVTVLTNVELFTEGLDLPNVDCVIQLRPTQSLALFLQFSMRAMNPRKNKTAIILDHVGNIRRFGLPTDDRDWELDQGRVKKAGSNDGKAIESPTVCLKCFGTFYKSTVKDGQCPYCHEPLPIPEDNLKEVDDELTEVKASPKKLKDSAAVRKRLAVVHKLQESKMYDEIAGKTPQDFTTFREFEVYAKLHNYKRGWAYYQAKERGLM